MLDKKGDYNMWCGVDARVRQVTLVGGFACDLTAEELNDWHKYMIYLNVYQALCEDMLREECVMHRQQATPDDLCDLAVIIGERIRGYKNILFYQALEWYTSLQKNKEEKRMKELSEMHVNSTPDENGQVPIKSPPPAASREMKKFLDSIQDVSDFPIAED